MASHLLRSSRLLCDLACRWISLGDEFASGVTSLVAVDAIRWSHISVRMLKQLKQHQQQRAAARGWEAGADDRTGRRRNWKLLILNYFRHIVCGLGTDVHACVHVAPVHRSACHLGHKTCRYPTPGVAAAVVSKPLFVVSTAQLYEIKTGYAQTWQLVNAGCRRLCVYVLYCIAFLYCTSWQNATYITYK